MKLLSIVLTVIFLASGSFAAEPIAVAVFDFSHTGRKIREAAPKITALLTANLTENTNLIVVERSQLKKTLGEQEFGLSGNISTDTAAKVGQLTGAKILVTGRVFKTDEDVVVAASIIGTENGRIYTETVKGPFNVTALSSNLAQRISTRIEENAESFLPEGEPREERIARIIKTIKGTERPSVSISVLEQFRDQTTSSSTVEAEFGFILMKAGFSVTDEKSKKKPEIEIIGNAVSSVGQQRGNMFPCRSVIDVKVRERSSGKILAFDRQSSEAVDIGQETGVKTSLEKATDALAERLLPLLAQPISQ